MTWIPSSSEPSLQLISRPLRRPLTSSNPRTLRLRLFSSAVLKLGLESSIRDALPLLLGFEAFLQSGIAGRSSHLIKHLKHIRAIPQQRSRLIPAWLIPLIPLLFSQCGISKKTETRTREIFLQLRHVARVRELPISQPPAPRSMTSYNHNFSAKVLRTTTDLLTRSAGDAC